MRRRTTTHRTPGSPVLRGMLVLGAVVLTGWCGPTIAQAGAATQTFTITGGPTGTLYPGSTVPLDLELTNPNTKDIELTALRVDVNAVLPGAQGTCTAADFNVDSGWVDSVVLPANATRLLSDLTGGGLTLPSIHMLDTAANQDGCKNAQLSLSYTATATAVASDSPSGGDSDGSNLPHTGADHSAWVLALAGLSLAAAGTTVVVITRRRSERS
jgi:LPXTG-motif cell wall-anchored protein